MISNLKEENTLFVRGNDHFMACGNRDILIAYSIACTNLGAFGIEGDSEWTTVLCLLRSSRIVNYTLVVLYNRINKEL
jgi:uncharacterized protein (DUF927 family)